MLFKYFSVYKTIKGRVFSGMLLEMGGGSMTAEFVRERITQLRLRKGVSEYKMSYDLGYSRGYINNISSGKSLPSMLEFFAICEYFNITPVEFFNDKISDPKLMRNTVNGLEQLNTEDLELIQWTVERLLKK